MLPGLVASLVIFSQSTALKTGFPPQQPPLEALLSGTNPFQKAPHSSHRWGRMEKKENPMLSPRYHRKRRIVQVGTLVLIGLVPAIGLFRIDLTTASFSFFDRPVYWSNYLLIFGMALVIATGPILTYLTIGAAWCGWACPQNSLSEWANRVTQRWLGKRATVDIQSPTHQIAPAKNTWTHWLLLLLIFLAASLVLGFLPFLFFYPLVQAWGLIFHNTQDQLATFMRRLYGVSSFLAFVDVAIMRHFVCKYVCLYRIGQRIFQSPRALHVTYDQERAADCSKCNYCATTCVTGIEPTRIAQYDSCIICGECVDACTQLHHNHPSQKNPSGLLALSWGQTEGPDTWWQSLRTRLGGMNSVVFLAFVVGCGLIVAGVLSEPSHQTPKPSAEQLRAFHLAEVCKARCAPQQTACQSGQMGACYDSAACQCGCLLEMDPLSPNREAWARCIRHSEDNKRQAASPANPGK